MEVASSRTDHLPTLSAAKTSKLPLLVKSPFGSGAADVGNATPTFCFSEPAISKLTTLTGFQGSRNPVSVVSFDIAGSLKQKVGVALPTSAAPLPKGDRHKQVTTPCLISLFHWRSTTSLTTLPTLPDARSHLLPLIWVQIPTNLPF